MKINTLEFSLSGGVVNVVLHEYKIGKSVYNGNFRMSGKSGHVYSSEFRKVRQVKLVGEEYKTPVSKTEREMITNLLEKDVLEYYRKEEQIEKIKYFNRVKPVFEEVKKLCPDYKFTFDVKNGKFVSEIFEIQIDTFVINRPDYLKVELLDEYKYISCKMDIQCYDKFWDNRVEISKLFKNIDNIENAKRLGEIIAESVNALKQKLDQVKQMRKLEIEKIEEDKLINEQLKNYNCKTEFIYKNDFNPITCEHYLNIEIKVFLNFLASDVSILLKALTEK